MAEKTCCVTGHRDIPEDRIAYVEQELRREVLAAIQDGYTRFISGFAEGADLMFAAIVVEQKKHNPDLFLEAAIPYAGRLKTKNKQFHELLRACDGIKIVCQEYTNTKMTMPNAHMVTPMIEDWSHRPKSGPKSIPSRVVSSSAIISGVMSVEP